MTSYDLIREIVCECPEGTEDVVIKLEVRGKEYEVDLDDVCEVNGHLILTGKEAEW